MAKSSGRMRRQCETDAPADDRGHAGHRGMSEGALSALMEKLRERLTEAHSGGTRTHRDDARAMVHLIADFEIEMRALFKTMRVQKDGVSAGNAEDPRQDLTNVTWLRVP